MIFKAEFTRGLEEYPRPQMKRNSYFSLNGEWDYAFSVAESTPLSYDGKINVPYSPESKLSGVMRQLKKDEFLHLKKVFTLPCGFNRGRVFLNVGACDQVTKVFLNGKFLHENRGGYNAFTVELENIVEGENQLCFVVTDNADSDVFGRGKQMYKRGGIWYTAISGIWQTCFLESTPDVYIRGFKFYPDSDNKKLTVTVDLSDCKKSAYVSVIGDNSEVVSGQTVDGKVCLDVDFCKEWTLDTPELYKVILKADDDEVESYFGLRKFSRIKKGDKWFFAINNKPVFMSGLLDQGYWHEGIYTPPSNRAMYDELKALKDMGFNMLRKHIKTEPMLWYYYCDILGIAVWQDMLNGGKRYKTRRIYLGPFVNLHLNDKNYKSMGRDNPESRKQYKYEANGLIDQLFNVPSLYLWTVFNEGWGQFDAKENCEELSKKDGTRLYDHASGWQDKGAGDVCSKHIYFHKVKLKNDYKRVLALTEFGGYTLYTEGHVFTDKKFGYRSIKSRKDFENAYKKLYYTEIIPMIKTQGLSATCYTQVSDVEDEINGLFTYDRVLKVDPSVILEVNKKLYQAFEEMLNS